MTDPRKNTGNTRGRPFKKGNPGRPKGARHKVTCAVEALLEGDAEALTRKAIEKALDGDTVALRLCLERISGTVGQPIRELAVPSTTSGACTSTAKAFRRTMPRR
jgi:hypothetical protein